MSQNRRSFLKTGAALSASMLATSVFSMNPSQTNVTANKTAGDDKKNIKHRSGLINERTKFIASNDNRATLPRYTPEAIKANWGLIDILTEFGNHRGYTAAQVALAYLLAQKPWIVPIPGTTKLAHLQENLWAADIGFTPEELKGIAEAVSKITVVGDRYTGQSAQQVRN